jgi:hypothetical protein
MTTSINGFYFQRPSYSGKTPLMYLLARIPSNVLALLHFSDLLPWFLRRFDTHLSSLPFFRCGDGDLAGESLLPKFRPPLLARNPPLQRNRSVDVSSSTSYLILSAFLSMDSAGIGSSQPFLTSSNWTQGFFSMRPDRYLSTSPGPNSSAIPFLPFRSILSCHFF